MTLNLDLSTKAARTELASFRADLAAVKTQIESFSSGKGLEKTLDKLATFKGIEASAVSSLNALARAMENAVKASSVVNNISKSLNSLARVRVDAVASNIERVSKALNGLRIPPTVERFAQVLARINLQANQAASSVRRLGGALSSVRVPAGLNSLSTTMGRVRSSTSSAVGGFVSLRSASSAATNALAGFGVVLGAFGFAQFVTGAFESVRAMDQFKNSIMAVTQDTRLVGEELAFVQNLSARTATSFNALATSYGKYSVAARLSGQETEEIHDVFESVSIAARVMGLSTEQVKGSFEALTQMASKGRVSMEELRQQLGDRFPGAVQMMAKGLGYGTENLDEFFKAVSKGGISAQAGLNALATELRSTYEAQLPAAMQTTTAAVDSLFLAFENMQRGFGTGFFDAMRVSLANLAAAMNDPSFIQGAQSLGSALGTALSVVVDVIRLVIQNFDALKYAVMAIAAVQLSSIVYGWTQSLAVAGQVATMTAANLGAIMVQSARLGFVSNMLIGLRAALLAAAGGAAALGLAISPMTLALIAVGVVVAGAIILYNNWASVTTYVSGAMSRLSAACSAVAATIAAIIPDWVIEAFSWLAEKVLAVIDALFPLNDIVNLLAAGFNALVPSAEAATNAITSASNASLAASSSASSASSSVNNLGSSFASSASSANNAASAYSNAARAASQAASAASSYTRAASQAASASRGSSVVDEWNRTFANQKKAENDVWTDADEARAAGVDPSKVVNRLSESWKGGGIVGGYNPRARISVPETAFINAPRFAGGGLSDGGIPAVLHPNEAVVPLTGGGEIPVANVSTGQGSLLLLKPLTLLVDYAKQTKTEISRIWEATTNQTVLMKNALDRIETTLNHIDNVRFPELANSIATAISNLSSYMSSGTYYTSSGGTASGRTAAGNDAAQVDKLFRYLDVAAQTGVFPTGTGLAAGGGGKLVMVDGKVMAADSPQYAAALAEKVRKQVEKIKAFVNAGYYSDAEINKLVQQWDADKNRMRGFATGSPNAWKDVTGGFTATLHPDEAVIPLPDGRSVPVDMPSSFMKRVQQIISEGDARVMNSVRSVASGSGSGTAVNTVVNMTINAKDVESFRASQDQLMRDLQKKLSRAQRRVGNTSDVEDPTKRV